MLVLDLAVGLAAGSAGGVAFFGGLHWTVRRLPASRRPVVLATVSFVVRGLLLAALLVAAAGSSPIRVLAGLGGVLLVRTVLVRRVRRSLAAEGGETWT